ncbi:MAG TPA: sulfate ABC transporter substrate-binding protein [Pirellulales bacterium]|nr:sulfate ABC transporter substrate-binding protein [Pirellulales bacterium]
MSRRPQTPFRSLLLVLLAACGCDSANKTGGPSPAAQTESQKPLEVELLNVSYDPTRELWRDINQRFQEEYAAQEQTNVTVKQSHGGSGSQARAVIDGLEADVVTLALYTDTDAIRKAGLIEEGWQNRLPFNSLPYFSTIVFVVRKGNPKGIKDWPDLVREGIEIVTPSPKTSGNGKLSFLAAWGSVVSRGGSPDDALEFVKQLYRHTPVLDSAARGATTTFAQKGIGDVHLTWENESRLEVEEAKGELEVVYPPVSIRAEPYVAVVDANAKRKGVEKVAEDYLRFVYTPVAQEIIARHGYRPINDTIRRGHEEEFPEIELFSVNDVAEGSWDGAYEKFFAAGAVFDQIYQPTGE